MSANYVKSLKPIVWYDNQVYPSVLIEVEKELRDRMDGSYFLRTPECRRILEDMSGIERSPKQRWDTFVDDERALLLNIPFGNTPKRTRLERYIFKQKCYIALDMAAQMYFEEADAFLL